MSAAWEPFNRGAFASTLDEIEDMLGDLHGIDLALDRIIGHGDADQELVYVTLGDAMPFRIEVLSPTPPNVGGMTSQHYVESIVAESKAEGYLWARSQVSALRDATESIAQPDIAEFEDAVQMIQERIATPLGAQVTADMATLQHTNSDWRGASANQFFDYVYNAVLPARDAHLLGAVTMTAGIAASKLIVDLGQRSAQTLVGSSHDLVKALLEQRYADYGSRPVKNATWLMIGATVAALLTAIPSAGASTAELAVAAGGAAGTLMGAASSAGSATSRPLAAATATEAAEQLTGGLSTLTTFLDEQWDSAEHHVTVLNANFQTIRPLYPQRPNIIHGTNSHNWHNRQQT